MNSCESTSLAEPAGSLGRPRTWWEQCLHWAVEARSHRVILLVAAIWMLNAFDLTLTVLSHQQGVLDEQNPVARHMLQYGVLSVALYKVGLVLIGTYPLLRFRTARITELGTLVIVIAYATLAVRWSRCYDFYTLAHTCDVNVAEIAPLSFSGSTQ